MQFKKYQHIEKVDHPETDGLLYGKCYIFPKIDGTNASVWIENGELQCGSRNRHLSIDNDNAGFMEWATKQENIKNFMLYNPCLRLFGEWLVPHTLKTYYHDAWRRFYVFDVIEYSDKHEKGYRYLPYDEYSEMLKQFGIDFIPPISVVHDPTKSTLQHYVNTNDFLIEDGKGVGEGIVVKNYDFVNKNRRTIWAKIVRNDFKYENRKNMGAPVRKGQKNDTEGDIVNRFLTTHMIDKVFAKITLNEEWNNKMIPRLLSSVYYDLITEEMWNITKKMKNPTIDFKRLMGLVYSEVKRHKSDLI